VLHLKVCTTELWKLLNFHKISKLLSEFRYLAEKHFRIFCTFPYFLYLLFHNFHMKVGHLNA
jgi:hypothetical protein